MLFSVALNDIFKNTYNLEPEQLNIVNAFIMFPWDFKILYGIICDTIKLPFFSQSPKRGYIILFAAIQCSVLFASASTVFENYETLELMFFIASMCGAFMDVVIDGLTTIQQRKDPDNGA